MEGYRTITCEKRAGAEREAFVINMDGTKQTLSLCYASTSIIVGSYHILHHIFCLHDRSIDFIHCASFIPRND